MLIHIGNGYLVRDRDVIGFFDIDGSVTPAVTADFLKKAEKGGRCASAVLDLPRSFVLSSPAGEKQGGERDRTDEVILTHISSSSLAGRGNGQKGDTAKP